jgi:hypothetical protein
MHAKTLARPLMLCSLVLAVGCVDEWRSDGFDDDFDSDSRGGNGGNCSCVTDPNDNNNGNTTPEGCPSEDDGAIYVGTTSAICTTITYSCPDTHTSFADPMCGCGCEVIPDDEPVCPTEDGEGITRISRDLKVCSSIQFTCPEGSDPFNGTCGCGCLAQTQTSTTPSCPDVTDPNVFYLGEDGSAVCEMISFTCPENCVQFNNECGCGCIENG